MKYEIHLSTDYFASAVAKDLDKTRLAAPETSKYSICFVWTFLILILVTGILCNVGGHLGSQTLTLTKYFTTTV